MNVTTTPAPKSSVLLEIELPPERLDQSDGRGRPPPGPAHEGRRLPARQGAPVHARAGARPRRGPRRGGRPAARVRPTAMRSSTQGIVPLAQASVDVVQAEQGKPFKFTATVQVPPEVTLGDYADFNFTPEIETIDDAKVTTVIDELRDQNASLRPVEDRPAQTGRLRGHRLRRDARRRAVRGRLVGADAADPRRGAAHPGLRGPSRRAGGRRLDRVRHRLPRGLRRGDPGRPDRPLRGRPQGAPREGPARARRRVRAVDGRLRRPGRTAGRDPAPARAERPRPGPPRVRRPDHRVRGGQRDRRAARHPGRPGGRGHARRVPLVARSPGDRRAGLPQGDEADGGGPPHRVPAARRGTRQDAARAVQDRRGRVDRGHRRGRRGGDRYGPPALRRGPADDRLLRVRARPELHPEHAPPDADRRDARRPLAGRPPRPSGAAPLRGRGPGRGRDRVDGRRGRHRCDRPVDRARSRSPDTGYGRGPGDVPAAAGPISDEPAAPAASRQESSPAADPA